VSGPLLRSASGWLRPRSHVLALITGVSQFSVDTLLVCCCSVQYVAEKRKQVPEALKLLPLVPVDGLPSEPDTDRPYKVTVISTTPGVKPMAVGVVGESVLTAQSQSWCGPCAVFTFFPVDHWPCFFSGYHQSVAGWRKRCQLEAVTDAGIRLWAVACLVLGGAALVLVMGWLDGLCVTPFFCCLYCVCACVRSAGWLQGVQAEVCC
jgi:hypothetical protein